MKKYYIFLNVIVETCKAICLLVLMGVNAISNSFKCEQPFYSHILTIWFGHRMWTYDYGIELGIDQDIAT